MQQSTKVFEGLFDKFGEEPEPYQDILFPIKRELERFLYARQKSHDAFVTDLASDYGVPALVWEPNAPNLRELEQMITARIRQLDSQCNNTICHLSYKDSAIVINLDLTVNPPWQREPLSFAVNCSKACHLKS